jgi:hypothetical protein
MEPWARGPQPEAFRTGSGVTVLRERAGWGLFVNDPALSAGLANVSAHDGPFYLDGLHTPLFIRWLFGATSHRPGTVRARIVLMSAGEPEALAALSLAPFEDVLASGRVELWLGMNTPARLREEAEGRSGCSLGGVIVLPGAAGPYPRWARRAPAEQLAAAGERQRVETQRVRQQLGAWVPAPRGDRLRVLLPTTRYSTYIQHAAGDLAHTIRGLGHETLVVTEPDDTSTMATLGMLRAIDRFRPDVVFFINTIRPQSSAWLPACVPAITWVQDPMPALFNRAMARGMGPRDAIVGHLHPEMLERLGVPRERTLYSTVLASDAKFHPGPADPRDAERFACEIAYVSHRSETPEALARRLTDSDPAGGLTRTLTEHLAPRVIELARGCDVRGPSLLPGLLDLTREALTAHASKDAPEHILSDLLHQITHPLAELALRHQMLEWAADLCEARGWRLHIYGRGWESHPLLARHARGELPHDESLRVAYSSARLHLHAGLGGVYHQRVLECALSGGCTLARLKPDDLRHLEWWAQNEITHDVPADSLEPVHVCGGDFLRLPIADHPASMMVQALYDQLGMKPQHPLTGWQVVGIEQVREAPRRPRVPLSEAWLIGDPASCGFWSRQSFESAATAVILSDRRRQNLIDWQRSSALRHYSLSEFARRALTLISAPTSTPAPAGPFATSR